MAEVNPAYQGFNFNPDGTITTPWNPAPKKPSTNTYFNVPGVEYGYNALTGNYEIKTPGTAYNSVPGLTPDAAAAFKESKTATEATTQLAESTTKPILAQDPLEVAIHALVAPTESENLTVTSAPGKGKKKAASTQKAPTKAADTLVKKDMLTQLIEMVFPSTKSGSVGIATGSPAPKSTSREIEASVAKLMNSGKHNEAAANAIARGQKTYDLNGTIGSTVAMNGKVRNTYADKGLYE